MSAHHVVATGTTMTAFKPRETLTEQVARHIENLIAFGQLTSGQRIYETAMAKQQCEQVLNAPKNSATARDAGQ
ncbi:MAG: hypothetical protein WD623_03000 [Marinobacter sp.]|uniref:hypothetical protein n=1 Tax=Marinobacter sp. TaxID=50741 RepID=UPI0034A03B3F